jgi:hypothetical protein
VVKSGFRKDCYLDSSSVGWWESLTLPDRNNQVGLQSMWDSILLQVQDLHTLDWQSIEQDQKTR